MSELPRSVVMTGAAGLIGRSVTPLLPDRWNLQLTDVVQAPSPVRKLDVSDGQACRTAFAGADAVIHLAAIPEPDASWEELLPANVIGAYQVAQSAIDCGVRRLVLASSLQTVSGYPDVLQVRASDGPRPANLYGATKAWSEALGAWVAETSETSVVALRIGYFAVERPTDATATARDLAAWLSPRDCADLLRAAVEKDGLRFLVANGISANRYRKADLSDTIAALGYCPRDDAWADY